MAQVNAKCTNCGESVLIDDKKEANVCPVCKEAFITEKAIALYNGNEKGNIKKIKSRHVWKSLGLGALLVLKCIGYLFYVICLMWLFFDITDNLKKK